MSKASQAFGKRLNEIQQAYTRLWTAFGDAAIAQRLGADASDSRGAAVDEREGVTKAVAEFVLKGWNYKAVSDKRSVDIAVMVTEVLSADLSTVTKSTTCVGYFLRDTEKKKALSLLEVHYDYETPPREAHPIFHLHIDATNWPEDRLQLLGLVGTIERPEGQAHYGNVRIPTAFMGYGPILVALAADHLEPRNFRLMMKAAYAEQRVNPECKLLAAGLSPAGVPHGHYWYDPRYVVHEWIDNRGTHRASVPVLPESFSDREQKGLRAQVAKKLRVSPKELVFVQGEPPG